MYFLFVFYGLKGNPARPKDYFHSQSFAFVRGSDRYFGLLKFFWYLSLETPGY